MLTKQERAEIAERLKGINFFTDNEIYKAITGKCVSVTTTYNEDIKRMIKAVLDLCDTSNMVELPLDKDGKVIRVCDTVFDTDGNKVVVDSLRYCAEYGCVVICTDDNSICTYSGNELTHKSPVTTKLLAQRIKYVLENEATSIGVNPYVELGRIAEQLESLGDSND